MIHYHKNLDSWLAFSDFFCDNVEKVGGATMVELAPQRWIEDKAILRDVYEMGGTVCGGYPRLLIGLNVNDDIDCFSDIDIFPRSETSYNQLLHYFAHMVRSVNPSDKVLWNAKKTNYNNREVWSFYRSERYPKKGKKIYYRKVQLVKDWGIPEEIIESFDFTVCQAFLDMERSMIIGTEEFLRDEKSRSLIINYKTPHLFGFRLSKYLDKGYIPPESEFIKIIGYTSMEEDPGLIFLGILFSLMDCHSRLKFHLPTYEDAELYVKKLLFFARGCPNWYFNYEFMVNRTFRELKYTYGIEARPRPFLYSDLLF